MMPTKPRKAMPHAKPQPALLPELLPKLLHLSRDPQAWIAGLALITLLGLGTGSFEPAASNELAAAQEQEAESTQHRWPQAGEQVASLDLQKL